MRGCCRLCQASAPLPWCPISPALTCPLVLSWCHNWKSFHLLRADCELRLYLVPPTLYLIRSSQSLYKAGASIVSLLHVRTQVSESGCSAVMWQNLASPLGQDLCDPKAHVLSHPHPDNFYSITFPHLYQHAPTPFLPHVSSQSQPQPMPLLSNVSRKIPPPQVPRQNWHLSWIQQASLQLS